jgi:hypothetical protein
MKKGCIGLGKPHVRLWHLADITAEPNDVRFWGNSGHGLKRLVMSAADPKRTSAAKFTVTHNTAL